MLVDAESPSLSHSIHTDDLQPTIASTRINPYSYRFPIHLLLFQSMYPYYTHYCNSRCNASPLNLLWRSGVFAHMLMYNGAYYSTLQCPCIVIRRFHLPQMDHQQNQVHATHTAKRPEIPWACQQKLQHRCPITLAG